MVSSLVKSFTNTTFDTNLTVIMIGDQIWFIAKEVAETLEYASTQKALQCVKDKYKKVLSYNECKEISSLTNLVNLTLQSMSQGLKLINKSGLIQLVLNSTKPEAEVFQDWVLEEVIPQVLEKGSYGVSQLSTKQQNILKLFDNKTSDADKAIALKEIVDEETSTANKRAFTSMWRLGGVTSALNAARDALNTANETIKSITSEYDALRESNWTKRRLAIKCTVNY